MKIHLDKQNEYDLYKAKNTQDRYSARVVSYAEDWANLMEKRLPEGATLAEAIGLMVKDDFAKNTSHEADTDGITGFMYGCAVSVLAHFWVHGEALRRWHNKNTQIGTEGDEANAKGGVLNQAMLTISA